MRREGFDNFYVDDRGLPQRHDFFSYNQNNQPMYILFNNQKAAHALL